MMCSTSSEESLACYAFGHHARGAAVAASELKFVHELAESNTHLTEQAWYEGPTGCHASVVKSFRPGFVSAHTRHLSQFIKEVKSLTGLQHRNLVPVLGVGSYDTYSWPAIADSLYVVEEYAGQLSLGRLIRDRLAPNQARFTYTYGELLRWMIQVAEALNYLHSQGVYHGDVSCRNVYLTLPDVHKANAKLGDLKPHRATYALDLRCPQLHTQQQLIAAGGSKPDQVSGLLCSQQGSYTSCAVLDGSLSLEPDVSLSVTPDITLSVTSDTQVLCKVGEAELAACDARAPEDQDAGRRGAKPSPTGTTSLSTGQLTLELQTLLDQAAGSADDTARAFQQRRCPRFSYSLGSGPTLLLFPPHQLRCISDSQVLYTDLHLPALNTTPSIMTPLEQALGYKPGAGPFQAYAGSSQAGDTPPEGSSPTKSSSSTLAESDSPVRPGAAGPLGAGHRMAAAQRPHRALRTNHDIQWQPPGSSALLSPSRSRSKQHRSAVPWPYHMSTLTPPATPATLQSAAGGSGRWGSSSSFRRYASGVWEEATAPGTPAGSLRDQGSRPSGSSPTAASASSSVWTNFLMSGHTAARLAAEHPRILHMSKTEGPSEKDQTSKQPAARQEASPPLLRRTNSLPIQVGADELEPPTKSELLKQAAELNGGGVLVGQSSLDKSTPNTWGSSSSVRQTSSRNSAPLMRAASARASGTKKGSNSRARGMTRQPSSIRPALKTSPSWHGCSCPQPPAKKTVSFACQAASNRLPGCALPCLTAPPEALTSGPTAMCTAAADVYNFGWVLYQGLLRTVVVPEGTTDQEQWEWIREHARQGAEGELPRLPAFMPAELVEVVDQCWLREPSERPSMSEVVERLRELQQDPGFMGELKEASHMLKRQIEEEAMQMAATDPEAVPAVSKAKKANSSCYGDSDVGDIKLPGCGPCRIS